MFQLKGDDRITKIERETLQQINDLEYKLNQKIIKSMDAVFSTLIPEYFNNLREPLPFIDQHNFNIFKQTIQTSIFEGEKGCRKYYEELFFQKNEADFKFDTINQKIQEIQNTFIQNNQSNSQNNEIQNLLQKTTELESQIQNYSNNFSNLENQNKQNYQFINQQQQQIQELQLSHNLLSKKLEDLSKIDLNQELNNQQQKFESQNQEIKNVIQKFENIKNTQELFRQEFNYYKQNEAKFNFQLDKIRNEFDEIRSKYSDINNQLLNIDSLLKQQDSNQKFEQIVKKDDQKNIIQEFKQIQLNNEKDKIQQEMNKYNQQNNQQQQFFQGNQQRYDQKQSNIRFQSNIQNTNFQKYQPQQTFQNNFPNQQNNTMQFNPQNQNQQFNSISNQNQQFGPFQTNQQQGTQPFQFPQNNQFQQQSQIKPFGNQNQQKQIPQFNTSKEVKSFINQIYNLTNRIRSAQGYQQQFVKECQSFQDFCNYYSLHLHYKKQLQQICIGFRQVRGDGNCFYTAFGFQVLQIVIMEYNDQQFQQFINQMEELIHMIGFEIRFNENKENNPELGKKLYQEFIQRIKYFRSHSIEVREYIFTKHFQQYEQDLNDELNDGCLYGLSCIYFRNLANYLVQNSELKDSIYDKETLLEWEKECNSNEVVILILAKYLNMKCLLIYMEKDDYLQRTYNEEGANQIILLIKPGHYNIGIPNKQQQNQL